MKDEKKTAERVQRSASEDLPVPPAPAPATTPTRRRFDLLTTPDLERVVADTFVRDLADMTSATRARAIRSVRELLAERAVFMRGGAEEAAPEVLVANLAMRVHAPSTRVDKPHARPRLRDSVEVSKGIAAKRAEEEAEQVASERLARIDRIKKSGG